MPHQKTCFISCLLWDLKKVCWEVCVGVWGGGLHWVLSRVYILFLLLLPSKDGGAKKDEGVLHNIDP